MITSLSHRPVKKKTRKGITSVVLIGFMGAGKTHCGRILARELGWRYRDSDAVIEKREGKTVRQVFKTKGESYFRTVESKVIKDLLKKPQSVLSFGGGAVCRKVNRLLIRKGGFVIWIKAKAEVIHRRTKKLNQRPLLNVSEPQKAIVQLLKIREPYYRHCAAIKIFNNGGSVSAKLTSIPQIRQIIRKQRSNGSS